MGLAGIRNGAHEVLNMMRHKSQGLVSNGGERGRLPNVRRRPAGRRLAPPSRSGLVLNPNWTLATGLCICKRSAQGQWDGLTEVFALALRASSKVWLVSGLVQGSH